jgi:hypothetical protein
MSKEDLLLYDPDFESDLNFFNKKLKGYYKELPPFLEYHSSFPRSGKQGILGLFVNPDTGKKYVYKISQYLNFLIEQEYSVMEGLRELNDYCPNFCKTFGIFRTRMSEHFRKEDNPFDVDTRSIEGSVLIMENVEHSRKLYRYIKNKEIPIEIIMSLIKQTLLATMMANENGKFTHYDLHSNNVLVQPCPINSVFLYVLDENRTYLVPTYGYLATIIDFGFSYHNNCQNRPLFGALAHTDIGFIPAVNDSLTDMKLFLTSVSNEVNDYKPCKNASIFRQLVMNIYGKCNVDLECGWDVHDEDDDTNTSISDYLLKKMDNQFKRSKFFRNQGHHVVDLLQSLILLPIRQRKTEDDLEDLAGILITEFAKLEREIESEFYNLYMMKQIIDGVLRNREAYLNRDTREKAVATFKSEILEELDKITKFCQPKINWEKLLCCMLCLGKCIENLCHNKLKTLLSEKKASYNNMLLRTPTEVYEAVDANTPSHFYFNEETVVYIWDANEKKSGKFTVPAEWVDEINQTDPYERGTFLYELITNEF